MARLTALGLEVIQQRIVDSRLDATILEKASDPAMKHSALRIIRPSLERARLQKLRAVSAQH
jgi:hypothetical protein